MRLYYEATEAIQKEFGKVKVQYTPNNGSPKMVIAPDNKSVTFNLHAIHNGKELLGLISQAKNQLGVGKNEPVRV